MGGFEEFIPFFIIYSSLLCPLTLKSLGIVLNVIEQFYRNIVFASYLSIAFWREVLMVLAGLQAPSPVSFASLSLALIPQN